MLILACMKKTALSGIQPSGTIHIGNYLGAIAQWVENQNKYNNIFCVVDLHAITVPQNPKELKENTYLTAAIYLAAGIDPKKSIIFVQSHIPAHTELSWILTTTIRIASLHKMTQFKNKAGLSPIEQHIKTHTTIFKSADTPSKMNAAKQSLLLDFRDERIALLSAPTGLLTYPALMAADILLYNTNVVPVGNDQKQHIEFTRNLAQHFNKTFGRTFVVPEPLIRKSGARIMGLDNPDNKMSKSAINSNNYIALTDKPEVIRKKIMRAVTDSGKTIKFDPKRKGLHNLLTIYKLFSGKTESQIEKCFKNKGYGDFKKELADLVIKKLTPIQKKTNYYMKNKKLLDKILANGAKQAKKIADKTLAKVKDKIGFIKNK